MAKAQTPDALKRRHLLEGELPPEESIRLADAYLEEDRVVDAVAFFAKAEARDRLEALQEEAVAQGDAFLLREISAALKTEPGAQRWRNLAEAARAAGKESYAADADRQATRGDD